MTELRNFLRERVGAIVERPGLRRQEMAAREDAIERARGAFKRPSGPSSDQVRQEGREEEREIEERKYG